MIVATSKIKCLTTNTTWMDFYDIDTDECIGSYDSTDGSLGYRFVDSNNSINYSYTFKYFVTLFDVLKFLNDNEDMFFNK